VDPSVSVTGRSTDASPGSGHSAGAASAHSAAGPALAHGAATVTFPGYSITEFIVPASGLTATAAHPRPAAVRRCRGGHVSLTGAGC
jgi:hypothetical protein